MHGRWRRATRIFARAWLLARTKPVSLVTSVTVQFVTAPSEDSFTLGRIKHLRGPGPSQGCGAPMGPQNLSIDQHGNLSVNLFVLKTISFTFPFSFSPSFPPFSFFSLFFLSQLLLSFFYSEASSRCGAPPRRGARGRGPTGP